jgi:hypothetical protein
MPLLFNKHSFSWSLPLAMVLLHGAAQASCGSAFCTVNTYWDTQGLSNAAGLNIDLRYSYARANRLRAGSQPVTPAAPSGSDDEIENGRTINQLLELEADYAINDRWNVAVGVPLVVRDHAHTFDSSISGPFEQQARFTSLGDIRVVGKYKFDTGNPLAGGGIRLGLKLPTGSIGKTMNPPDPAAPTVPYALERSAQPGSGSTDIILGAYRFGNWPDSQWNWFASGQLQSAIATRDGYRPGRLVQVDLGLNYSFSQELVGLLQLNLHHRARDTGAAANPASGGYSVNLSPGLSYAFAPQSRVYAFVQKAIVQHVNTDPATGAGQLVAPWSVAVGISRSF